MTGNTSKPHRAGGVLIFLHEFFEIGSEVNETLKYKSAGTLYKKYEVPAVLQTDAKRQFMEILKPLVSPDPRQLRQL